MTETNEEELEKVWTCTYCGETRKHRKEIRGLRSRCKLCGSPNSVKEILVEKERKI